MINKSLIHLNFWSKQESDEAKIQNSDQADHFCRKHLAVSR